MSNETLLEKIIRLSKLRKGDPVFNRLSEGCPSRKDYHEKNIPFRCRENGLPCLAHNCSSYHWFKRK